MRIAPLKEKLWILALFLLLEAAGLSLLYWNHLDKERNHLAQFTGILSTAYTASVNLFRLSMDTLYTETIQRPEVLKVFASGVDSAGEARDRYRAQLLEMLGPTYASMQKRNVRQLHFHCADGTSFLRFHQVDRYGDNLFDARPSIRIANREHRIVHGFETGKVMAGFRYVYPVDLAGRHIGSVETSISFAAIRNALLDVAPNREYSFIILSSAVESKLFQGQEKIYGPSGIHPGYLFEDPLQKLPNAHPPLSPVAVALNDELRRDRGVREAMDAGVTITEKVEYDGRPYAVSLLAINDVEERHVGYLIAYAPAPYLQTLEHDLYVSVMVLTGMLLLTAGLFSYLRNRNRLLDQEHGNLKAVTDAMAEGLYVVDAGGMITLANPMACRLLGYEQTELAGRQASIIHQGLTVGSSRIRLSAPGGGDQHEGPFTGEADLLRKDGSLIPVELTWQTIRNDTLFNGTVAVFRDISGRRETERLQQAARLEAEAARQSAEAANQAKSLFLANMSHEIRTPMNGIIGMGQLLQYTELSDEQKEYLDIIKSSSKNLLALINDILDLSRIESGRIELEQHEFSLRTAIREVVTSLMPLAQEKGLNLTVTIPDNIPDILVGDQLRLKQIILNFVANALKFTASGGIVVSVSPSGKQGERHCLAFSVSDTGIGIPLDACRLIFEPFSQADASITRKFGGSGLGLAICRRLTELMGGHIWVDSTEGAGSTFNVRLPFEVSLHQEGGETDNSHETHEHQWEGPPLRILIADDTPLNLTVMAGLLHKAGMTTVTVANGSEAVAIWEQGGVDLVLMDVMMPVLDGIKATEAIREREQATGGNIPIIALTARALREDVDQIMKKGFTACITKPVDADLLFREMRRCLAAVNSPAEEEAPAAP